MKANRLDIGDIIVPWQSEEPGTVRWVELGKPEVWIMSEFVESTPDIPKLRLFEDSAYGRMAIVDKTGIILAIGKDYLEVYGGKLIALSCYYTGTKAKLYKHVGGN